MLFIGLGNPGEKYEGTRHNAGRDFLRQIAFEEDFPPFEKNKGAEALYTKGELEGVTVEFLLPETFMNLSGKTAQYMIEKQGIDLSEVVVLYDDIDLPIGETKVSFGKGSGGHNGVESVVRTLKTKDFARIRIGIAPKTFFGRTVRPKGEKLSKYVLAPFTGGEKKKLKKTQEEVHGMVKIIARDGVSAAMNVCN